MYILKMFFRQSLLLPEGELSSMQILATLQPMQLQNGGPGCLQSSSLPAARCYHRIVE